MTVTKGKKLNRKELYRKMEPLYSDPKNYDVYVSEKASPELNRKIKRGELTITLQDLLDADGDIVKLRG